MSGVNVSSAPNVYHREYKNDLAVQGCETKKLNYATRVLLVALPFLSLYKPFQTVLSVGLGSMRSLNCGSHLYHTLSRTDYSAMGYATIQTTLAVIALSTALFAHPLGIIITSVHDLAVEFFQGGTFLSQGEFSMAMGSYFHLVNHTLFLSMFVYGGVSLTVASLAAGIFVLLKNTAVEAWKGNYLEACGHGLMGMIRGNQLYGYLELLQLQAVEISSEEVDGEEQMNKHPTTFNFLHSIAYYLQKPVQFTSELILRAVLTPIRPGEDGNLNYPFMEKIYRITTVCLGTFFAPATIALYAIGEGFHFCANAIQEIPYTYFQGSGEEKTDEEEIKCVTLNACMLWGGLPIALGGCRPAKERMEQLVAWIEEQDADVVLLQEMAFPASVELFGSLKEQYPHCFTRIGPNFLRMESGLMVLSKLPVTQAEFLPFPDQNGIKRGAFFIETPKNIFVTTHLEASDHDLMRKEQFNLLVQRLDEIRKEKDRNAYILGDLNIDSIKSDQEYKEIIGQYPELFDPRRDQHRSSESCTDAIANYTTGSDDEGDSMVDYALFYGNQSTVTLDSELIDTYSKQRPGDAISDHKGLSLEIHSANRLEVETSSDDQTTET